MTKTIQVRVPVDLFDQITKLAKDDDRSISNFVRDNLRKIVLKKNRKIK